MENKTSCAVSKVEKQLSLLKQPETPKLQLNPDMSFKAMVIIILAHLANIARPGTFGAIIKQLLKQSNLPEVILPDDAPSADIFRTVSAFPGNDLKVTVTEDPESDTESDIETTVDDETEAEEDEGMQKEEEEKPTQSMLIKQRKK